MSFCWFCHAASRIPLIRRRDRDAPHSVDQSRSTWWETYILFVWQFAASRENLFSELCGQVRHKPKCSATDARSWNLRYSSNYMSRLMTKPTKWQLRPAKTQISLGIRRVWLVFAVRMKKAWTLSYPLSAQRRLWSDSADAQADLSLRCAHISLVLSWGGSYGINRFTHDVTFLFIFYMFLSRVLGLNGYAGRPKPAYRSNKDTIEHPHPTVYQVRRIWTCLERLQGGCTQKYPNLWNRV